MFEHQQTAPRTPGNPAGDGEPPADPAATLARRIVGRDEHVALGGRIRLSLNGDDLRAASNRLGMDYHAVRRIVRGARPSPEFLRRLCQAYGIDGHWLLTGDGLMRPDARAADTLRVASSELLIAELSRRLSRLLAGPDSAPLEAAMLRGQQALDALRSELPQAP